MKMKRIGQGFAGLAGAGALAVLFTLPGCSSSGPAENVAYVPKTQPSRDEMQKAEYEKDKAAKAKGGTGTRRPR